LCAVRGGACAPARADRFKSARAAAHDAVLRAAHRHGVRAQNSEAFLIWSRRRAAALACPLVCRTPPPGSARRVASTQRGARGARDAVDEDANAEKRDARAEKRRRTVRAEALFPRSKTRFSRENRLHDL
jgi:hypothetical protein